MPLETLLKLIETLTKRIAQHGALLSQNELRTRYALIDPLLQELGWDTSDPAEVIVEESSGNGRADYLLFANGNPIMVVEAKRLGLGVADGRQQAMNYAMDPSRSARYFAVTDGSEWEIYDLHRQAIDMLLLSFGLTKASPAEVCLKVLALWRPSVSDGAVSAAQPSIIAPSQPIPEPILQPQPIRPQRTTQEPTPQPAISPSPISPQAPAPPPANTADWIPLSTLAPEKHSKPAGLIFPDNSHKNITMWFLLPLEVVRWLLENNISIPVPIQRTKRATRYIISDTPIHSDGKAFTQPKSVGMLHIETNYDTPQHADHARLILEHAKPELITQFQVRIAPS